MSFLLNENAKVNSPWKSSLVLYSACHTHFWLSVSWSVVFTSLSNLHITLFKWMCIYTCSQAQTKALFWFAVCSIISRKSAHGQSTLQVCQRGGWVLFHVFLNLTTKEWPHHVYSNLMPLKQILWQTTELESSSVGIQHSEWHCDHGVARKVCHISYVCLCKAAL